MTAGAPSICNTASVAVCAPDGTGSPIPPPASAAEAVVPLPRTHPARAHRAWTHDLARRPRRRRLSATAAHEDIPQRCQIRGKGPRLAPDRIPIDQGATVPCQCGDAMAARPSSPRPPLRLSWGSYPCSVMTYPLRYEAQYPHHTRQRSNTTASSGILGLDGHEEHDAVARISPASMPAAGDAPASPEDQAKEGVIVSGRETQRRAALVPFIDHQCSLQPSPWAHKAMAPRSPSWHHARRFRPSVSRSKGPLREGDRRCEWRELAGSLGHQSHCSNGSHASARGPGCDAA